VTSRAPKVVRGRTSTSGGEKAIPARATPKSRDEVGVSLAHNHLPRLDDLGILSYETAANTVEYYPNPALESVIQYVERLELG